MSKAALKKLVRKLDKIKGRHTEMVTVYIPAGANLNEVINQVRNEGSTADNIKSKQVRKNVTTSLDKIVRELSMYKKTPPNGIAIFCGNVSENDAKTDIETWVVEPPEPVKVKMYWCDQKFVLEPLKEMVEDKEIYGIICLDKSEADIALVRGKKIEPIVHFESIVPGKTRAGGQCLAPDTLVQMADGNLMEICKVGNPHIVKSADFSDATLKNRPVIEKWETVKDVKYVITTKCPTTQIESSKDHLFFKWGNRIEEIAAENLKKGDFLLVPEKIDVKGIIHSLNVSGLYNSYKINKEGREYIKHRRESLNLLQRDVAKAAEVTQAAVSVVELGKRDIKIKFLKKLCRNLDIDTESFIRQFCTLIGDVRLPETLDERLASFLGYFAGDGSFENERISLFDANRQTIEYYDKLARDIFSCNSSITFRESKGHYVSRIYGKPVVKMIKNEFPELKYAVNTEMPSKVLTSPNPVLAAFLRGFFDAEGYVNMERGIGLGINNKKMARQLQFSLLRFGILASVVEYDNRRNPYSKKHRFTIGITERISLEKFLKEIGFSASGKQEKLKTVLKRKSRTSYTRRIFMTGENVRKILESEGYKVSDFPKVTNFFRNERLMSKDVFRDSVLGEIKNSEKLYKKLEQILNYNLMPVKIKSIKKVEEEARLVDLEVKTSNFIANGLVVHNSSARFSRVREGLLHDWFKKVAEAANKIFAEHTEVLGIIISGTGPIKEFFLKEELMHDHVTKKILGTVDTGYTGEFGLHETLEKASELLKEAAVTKEKKLLQRFFQELQKPNGRSVYGVDAVLKALERGAVDFIILTEDLDLKIAGEDALDYLEVQAENYGSRVVLVSDQTREGDQFKQLCGLGAMLRY